MICMVCCVVPVMLMYKQDMPKWQKTTVQVRIDLVMINPD